MQAKIAVDRHPLIPCAFASAHRLAGAYFPVTTAQKKAHGELLAAIDLGDLGLVKEAMRRARITKGRLSTPEWAQLAHVWIKLVEQRIEPELHEAWRRAA